mgnify:CR=1 FL=1
MNPKLPLQLQLLYTWIRNHTFFSDLACASFTGATVSVKLCSKRTSSLFLEGATVCAPCLLCFPMWKSRRHVRVFDNSRLGWFSPAGDKDDSFSAIHDRAETIASLPYSRAVSVSRMPLPFNCEIVMKPAGFTVEVRGTAGPPRNRRTRQSDNALVSCQSLPCRTIIKCICMLRKPGAPSNVHAIKLSQFSGSASISQPYQDLIMTNKSRLLQWHYWHILLYVPASAIPGYRASHERHAQCSRFLAVARSSGSSTFRTV